MRVEEVVRASRVAACREELGVGKQWSFYFINEGDIPSESICLYEIDWEYGDGDGWNAKLTSIEFGGVAPHGHVLLWRDDGSVRMALLVRLVSGGKEHRLEFLFPRLIESNLGTVQSLGKAGYVVWDLSFEP